jgi:hypothetical protein
MYELQSRCFMGKSINVVLGFASVCAIISAIFFYVGETNFGGLFIAIAILVVILSMWLGRKGAA